MKSMNVVEVKEVVSETPTIKTLFFDLDMDISPGQFVMVWVPGVDEMPMSLSFQGEPKGITVRKVGPGTEALHGFRAGDTLGIRGPFGRGYELDVDRILAVMGGIGGASVLPAIESSLEAGIEVTCALGAMTSSELLFRERLEERTELHLTTDDGSVGHRGFVTDIIEDLMDDADLVITCGPELMMKRVLCIADSKGVPVQASLERYMKCGMGLCGSCVIDGQRACVEGPVFDGPALKGLEEFGEYHRGPSGQKIPLK